MVNSDRGHTRTQAQRSEATRAALLGAARELFARHGYAATPREDIVAAAGVTRGALQHHFTDKRSLFLAVYEAVEQEVVASVAAAAMRSGADPVEQLRAGCQAYLDAVLDPAVQRICAIDGPSVLPADVRAGVTDRYALGLVRETLRRAVTEGRMVNAEVEPFARVLLAGVTAAAEYVATAPKPRAARREAGRVLDLILDRLQP
jgi:AcrR family transcriptional regulator